MFNVGYYFNVGMMRYMNIGGNMTPYKKSYELTMQACSNLYVNDLVIIYGACVG